MENGLAASCQAVGVLTSAAAAAFVVKSSCKVMSREISRQKLLQKSLVTLRQTCSDVCHLQMKHKNTFILNVLV